MEPATSHPQGREASGQTRLTELAVAKVAAAAAAKVPEVFALGRGATRAFDALRGAVGTGAESHHGVNVEIGATHVVIDLVIVARYGRNLHEIADDVRAAVYETVHELTGLTVVEVNIEIGDVHLGAAEATS
ncbi:Asp23/Gls24 family envelope stress response protein [Glutamicibacter sp. PS]|uniref:Asp23/Gls24 family envelope stress response protein n=1 Tax=Glutamicibacter sp. PS TaxID=3075634 RepID=UPI002849139E|nr:Asp23/Gls24 family envelope stress response protein [Glutamicibacter sp. PS]MDR4534731.1 Asp23/Gls24 family envelope stress response protein [Glutamicibacter sp. PS]